VRPLLWVCIPLAAYLAIHLGLRLLLSDTLVHDEAEQVLCARELAWGYGAQPPLYSWLAAGFLHVFGVSIFSLALLRTLVLAGVYVLLYLNARRVVKDERLAVLAAFSVLLIPWFTYGTVRSLTHTSLMYLLSLATLYALLHLADRPTWRGYAMLGLCVGLGTLSKYNYVVFAAALLLAGLMAPTFRCRVIDRRLILTIVVTILVVLPHGLWLALHDDVVIGSLRERTGMEEQRGYWRGVVDGFRTLAESIGLTLALPCLIWLILFPQGFRRLRAALAEASPERRLLAALFVAGGVVLVLLVLAGGVTRLWARWLGPFFLVVPLFFFAGLELHAAARRRTAIYVAVLVAAALGMIALRAMPTWSPGSLAYQYQAKDRAIAACVDELRQGGVQPAMIIAHEQETAGCLALHFPKAEVLCALQFDPGTAPSRRSGPCIVAWQPRKGDVMPVQLHQLVKAVRGSAAEDTTIRRIAGQRRPGVGVDFRLNWVLLKDAP
jgi:hypothetical protein